jgi:hypothetical protein
MTPQDNGWTQVSQCENCRYIRRQDFTVCPSCGVIQTPPLFRVARWVRTSKWYSGFTIKGFTGYWEVKEDSFNGCCGGDLEMGCKDLS